MHGQQRAHAAARRVERGDKINKTMAVVVGSPEFDRAWAERRAAHLNMTTRARDDTEPTAESVAQAEWRAAVSRERRERALAADMERRAARAAAIAAARAAAAGDGARARAHALVAMARAVRAGHGPPLGAAGIL